MPVAKLFLITVCALFLSTAAPAAAGQDRGFKDAWITTQIQAKYFLDDVVKGRFIDVDTRNAVVTLSGDVATAAERQRAAERAREVEGVIRVDNRLTIGRGEKGTSGSKPHSAKGRPVRPVTREDRLDRLETEISDAWITAKVQSKYYLDPDVKGLQIDVTTNGGVLTLTGRIGSATERQKALSLAKSTDGVKQVLDRLKTADR